MYTQLGYGYPIWVNHITCLYGIIRLYRSLLMKRSVLPSLLIVSALFLSSCGPGQLFGPTITPMPTATNTNGTTSTPTNNNPPPGSRNILRGI